MDILTIAYLFFLIAPISILIHELGHVSGAFIVKADHIRLSIGIGNKNKLLDFNRLQVIVHSVYFIGGVTQSKRNIPYTKVEIILITFLGPAFNVIAACICLFIYEIYPNRFWQLFLWFNAWMAIINSIPFKIKDRQTDGYTILDLIVRKPSKK